MPCWQILSSLELSRSLKSKYYQNCFIKEIDLEYVYFFLYTEHFDLTAALWLYSFSNCLLGIFVTVAISHSSRIVQRVYFVIFFSYTILYINYWQEFEI